MDAFSFEGVLQGHTVYHGCKHAHIVSLNAIHTLGGSFYATEDVTATDNNRDLNSFFMHRFNFVGIQGQNVSVNPVSLRAEESLTA
jgi:hypothetical protein